MNTTRIDPKSLRKIEKMIEGTLAPQDRLQLREQLRSNDNLRRAYDFRIEALRELESQAIANAELDIVESWLFPPEKRFQFPKLCFRSTTSYAIAAAMVCLLLWLIPIQLLSSQYSEFRSKGSNPPGMLAIEVLCNSDNDRNQFASSNGGSCPIDSVIAFAHRIRSESTEVVKNLTIFGVDSGGRVLYYRPTPHNLATETHSFGQWVNSEVPVELGINHHPGVVQVYAIVSTRVVSIDQIDRWSRSLFDGHKAFQANSVLPLNWLDFVRSRDPQSVYLSCPQESSCATAQTYFTVTDRISP